MVSARKVIDIPAQHESEIVSGAQELWAKFYGTVRASGLAHRARRCDLGSKRVSDDMVGKLSVDGWLKQRKCSVSALVDQSVPVVAQQPDAAVWTEGHAKESKFLKVWTKQCLV